MYKSSLFNILRGKSRLFINFEGIGLFFKCEHVIFVYDDSTQIFTFPVCRIHFQSHSRINFRSRYCLTLERKKIV